MCATTDNLSIDMELTIDDARKMLEHIFALYEKNTEYDNNSSQL